MSKRTVIRGAATILFAWGLAWSVVSCASAPKVAPVPETVAPEPAAPVAEPVPVPEPEPVAAPVSEIEFQAAIDAISEAEAAGAEKYSSDLLNQARSALLGAREKAESDPEQARGLLRTAVEKANAARDAALAAKAAELQALLAKLDQQAQDAIAEAEAAGAETYSSLLLGEARDALTQARDQAANNPDAAQESYGNAIQKANQARDAALAAKAAELQALLAKLDQQAQDAIAEAEAAEADTYRPQMLNEARQAHAQGRDKTKSAPEQAQTLFESAIAKAQEARDLSLVDRTKALLDRLDQAVIRLKALQPERWDPEGTAPVLTQAEAARSAVETEYATGLPLATEALLALEEATSKLSARLVAVQDLRLRAQKALDEAEAVDAYVWVPDLVQSANDAFFMGTGAWKKFLLDSAEEAWNTALFEAQSATAKAQLQLERRRTEQLMLETMKKLEDASGKTVVDPQDNIIAPEAWDGQKELERLRAKPLSLKIPADGSVVVLGEKQRVTYLDEAKDQWAQGVRALAADDLSLANESFLQAQKLIETYLSLAVDKVYTVRLVPERRDSLWRIAENDGIYSTPWEWPKIWKRNQKLIQNPDLIYPGWQLIIPPQ